MSDDPLLQELARVARDDREAGEAELDERWDALAAGRLSPREEEELRALARSSPQAAAAYEAFRPLDAGFRARVTEAARFQLGKRRGAAPPSTAGVRRRRTRWWLPAAALAAASALFLLWPRPSPLPTYQMELRGHVRTLRSAAAEPEAGRPVFVRGNRMRLVLTPGVAVDGPVTARAFVARSGGLEPLDAPPPAVSDDGAVRFEGEVGSDLRLPAGDVVLLVAVGRAGSLPGGEELRSRLDEAGSVRTDAWSAWKVPLTVEDDEEDDGEP